MNVELKNKIPENILWTLKQLQSAGFEAFVVGGCVRDLFLSRTPHDWDVTTDATPEQIIEIFEKQIGGLSMKIILEPSES